MTRRVFLGAIILGVAIVVVVLFSVKKKSPAVSCDQNGGPFPTVSSPAISKDDIKEKLMQFYSQCLKPDYQGGFLRSSMDWNSESEAYALWQAYLAGDKNTFDRVLTWTNANLKRSDDNLFAWKFEINKHNPLLFWRNPLFSNYTVKIVDQNSATDADTDIAYVLFRAGADWKRSDYIDQAKQITDSIWDKETVLQGQKRFVVAGNWANEPNRLVINPSYYSPQAYRAFAFYDGAHDWNSLLAQAYDLLAQVSNHGSGQPVVPPNWVQLNKSDGSLAPYPEKNEGNDFGFDAFRVLWRTAWDQLVTPSFLSWNYVSAIKSFETDWTTNQQMCALYKYQNGNYVCDTSTTSTLAAPIGILSVTNGYLASQVIQKYYIRDGKLQFPDTDFYAKSWHWFATYLWAHS